MRASFFNRYDAVGDTTNQPISINFTGPLILHADPLLPLHASTKRYVDVVFGTALSADNITSEIVSVSSLPAFSGDVTSQNGSNVFTLKDSGVTVGNFSKLTVNSKGVIVNAQPLTIEDIPDLPWNKIGSGKPTTLTGYGINNGVRSTGDSLVGTLNAPDAPVNPMHAVNKEYVANKAEEFNNTDKVGTIVEKGTDQGVTGYLRCNGAELDKIAYSSLYDVVGERFTYDHGHYGNGAPWVNQYNINETGDSLGAWNLQTNIPYGLYDLSGFMVGNRLYITGGLYTDGGSYYGQASVYFTTIAANGSMSSWTTVTALPKTLYEHKHLIINNKVYLFGGTTYPSTTNYSIYAAQINQDNSIGSWNEVSVVDFVCNEVFVIKQKLYIMTPTGIYCSKLTETGEFGQFKRVSDFSLLTGATGAIITNTKIYIPLVYNSSSTQISDVMSIDILPNGDLGSFSLGEPTPYQRAGVTTIVTKNRVYLLGGAYYSSYTGNVQTAPINPDGTLGAWSVYADMGMVFYGGFGVITSLGVLAIGGSNINYYNSSVIAASLSGGLNDYSPYYDGTISVTDHSKFKLPDYTDIQADLTTFYIKY